MSLNDTVRGAVSRAAEVRVRNALNPLLWASAVIPAACWTAAYAFRDDLVLRYALAALGSLPILGSMVAYFFFMLKDPDRLQSEEFVLRQQELSLIEGKGTAPAQRPRRGIDSEDPSVQTNDRAGEAEE